MNFFFKMKILLHFWLPTYVLGTCEKNLKFGKKSNQNLAYLGQFFSMKDPFCKVEIIYFLRLEFGENTQLKKSLVPLQESRFMYIKIAKCSLTPLLQGETCYKIIIILFKLLYFSRYGICNWSVWCWKWQLFRFRAYSMQVRSGLRHFPTI
jgi:hypothetical protein